MKRENLIKVNLNDIKILHIPDTKSWKINEVYLREAIAELNAIPKFKKVIFDIINIGALIEDILAKRNLDIQFFIVPDWPCMG